ncbi:ABC-type peptide/nickel transport system substrate-binding protein [Candidatus Phytoplasma luffae]|uniref:ABC-type peptide/nickel transport system substrate-binding protein n=1 Tax=Loofah witches'-broom phytoplasma TaxID=35773 RepID=Q9S510_LOWBP|nr:ABC transporter substrate-binding protein [Candidatus Phytoplasma luffae]AAD48156.1 putative solute-binding lipoprotein [Candidatus Phytoplasma luffae]QTX02681.1 ABC-type peptide/nickel transport system substrate-binding protein [Candidatus Phytoplasma luffae]
MILKQKIILYLAIILFSGLSIWGIVKFKEYKDHLYRKDRMIIAISNSPKSLDFCNSKDTNSVYTDWTLGLFHSTLLKAPENPQDKPENLLVEEWDLDRENRKIKAKLKDGILFHNGNKMTTEDVIFTYNRAVEKEHKDFVNNIKSVQKIDELKFEIHLKDLPPFYNFIFYKMFRVLNKAAIDENESEGLKIGTGLYKLVSVSKDKKDYNFEKFENYHAKNDSEYLDFDKLPPKITLKVDPSNDNNLLNLEKKNIDLILSFPGKNINDNLRDKESKKKLNIKEDRQTSKVSYMYINQENTKEAIRKLIVQAIDFEKIKEELKIPNKVANGGLLPPILKGHDKTANYRIYYNKELAKTGVQSLTGEEKKINILTSENPDLALQLKVKDHLEEAGFEVKINQVPFNDITNKFITTNDYNILFLGEQHELIYGYKFFEDYFIHSDKDPKNQNFSHIKEEDADKISKLIKDSKEALDDDSFIQKIKEIEQYLYTKLYIIPTFYVTDYVLTSSRVDKEHLKINTFSGVNPRSLRFISK